MIERKFVIKNITPDELAFVFTQFDAEQQAQFFTRVGEIASHWPGAGWCQQSCAISEHLSPLATETILKLGEWAKEPYVKPQQARGQ